NSTDRKIPKLRRQEDCLEPNPFSVRRGSDDRRSQTVDCGQIHHEPPADFRPPPPVQELELRRQRTTMRLPHQPDGRPLFWSPFCAASFVRVEVQARRYEHLAPLEVFLARLPAGSSGSYLKECGRNRAQPSCCLPTFYLHVHRRSSAPLRCRLSSA